MRWRESKVLINPPSNIVPLARVVTDQKSLGELSISATVQVSWDYLDGWLIDLPRNMRGSTEGKARVTLRATSGASKYDILMSMPFFGY